MVKKPDIALKQEKPKPKQEPKPEPKQEEKPEPKKPEPKKPEPKPDPKPEPKKPETKAEFKPEKPAKPVDRAAELVEEKLKEMGATVRKPGIIIYGGKTAEQAVDTDKLWYIYAELEKKFPTGFKTPAIQQILFTRIGPTSEKAYIGLQYPLSESQIFKLKMEGLVEWMTVPFKEPYTIKKIGMSKASLDTADVEELARVS